MKYLSGLFESSLSGFTYTFERFRIKTNICRGDCNCMKKALIILAILLFSLGMSSCKQNMNVEHNNQGSEADSASNDDVTCIYEGLDNLNVIPVSAKYVESYVDSMGLSTTPNAGWNFIVIDVLLQNETDLTLHFPIKELGSEEAQQEAFRLVSSDGYEYGGSFVRDVLDGNAIQYLPPGSCFSDYLHDFYSGSPELTKLQLVFEVPSNISGYKFKYSDRKAVDISPLLSSGTNRKVIEDFMSRYRKEFRDSVKDYSISYEDNIKVESLDVSYTNTEVIVTGTITNNGGYDSPCRNFRFFIINSDGVFFDVRNFELRNDDIGYFLDYLDEYEPQALAPKTSYQFKFSRADFPQGFKISPEFLVFYDVTSAYSLASNDPYQVFSKVLKIK